MSHSDRQWKLALLDLDGTLYRGTDMIPGADKFVERLRTRGIQPVFFTNNSTRTPDHVAHKLQGMGIQAAADEVCTSSQSAAHYLRTLLGSSATICTMGQQGLIVALQEVGLTPVPVSQDGPDVRHIDGAALGLDLSATYDKLARFCDAVDACGHFVLTNPDARFPMENGFRPGCGALGRFVQFATGVQPYVAGKPSPGFIQYALERFQCSPEDTFIVGDNPDTDVAAGSNCGIYTIQVCSGVKYPATDAVESMHPSVKHVQFTNDLQFTNELESFEPRRSADEIHRSVADLF